MAEAQKKAAEEAARNTRRVNPLDVGEGDERKINRWNRQVQRRMQGEDFDEMMRLMVENQQRQMLLAKDEGLLGGRGESARNPGGRNNTGIDWLKEHYNPDNNPFEGRDLQADARNAVMAKRGEQAQFKQAQRDAITRDGYGIRDIGGATQTDFFGGGVESQGPLPDPTFSVMNVPEQYGGGFAYGSPSVALPKADPNLMLSTDGYNPQLGVGGSGVPMSAGEAMAAGHLGNGIYGEPTVRASYKAPDRGYSNASTRLQDKRASDQAKNQAAGQTAYLRDASVARRNLVQGGMKQRMREFFENPFPTPEPTMDNPAVSQTLPLLPAPAPTSQPGSPDILRPSVYKDLPPAPTVPIPALQDWAAWQDSMGANYVNPALRYLLGQEEVYPPEFAQRLFSHLLR